MRLLTFPARHAYLEAVRPAGVTPVAPERTRGWEPDPGWERPAVLLASSDVVHVHFGFDARTPAQLRTWCGAVRAAGLPLVVTVHDLRNPHHLDPALHAAQLGVLLAAAHAVLTLTTGAAAAVAAGHGRTATVVPHPAIYAGPTAPTEAGLVGVALKSLRCNVVDPFAVVEAAAAGAADAGGRLEVTAHHGVGGLDSLAGTVGLVRHDYLSEAEHQAMLSRLQVSVLANRWGSHSGWLEACRDVGTAVVAPSCGFYAEQWPEVRSYGNDESRGLDPASLRAAVRCAVLAGPIAPVDRSVRAAQLAENRRVHATVYRQARPRAAG